MPIHRTETNRQAPRRRSNRLGMVLLFLAGLCPSAEYSILYGRSGESWDPQGRLPDVSRAGYHQGEVPLPTAAIATDVRRWGAVGDGQADDTAAFQKALAKTPGGVVWVPPGRYKITDRLILDQSGLVLRGAGPAQTTLWFPESLSVKRPNESQNRGGRPTSTYSWSGGFLGMTPKLSPPAPIPITGAGPAGTDRLQVSSLDGLKIGERVEILVRDDQDQTLIRWAYDGDPGDISRAPPQTATMMAVITGMEVAKRTIWLDRGLRFPIRPEWNPQILTMRERLHDVGVESLTCEFPDTPYEGHFTERGFNAISIGRVVDCWVRDVAIVHAESGIFLNGAHCTIQGVVFTSGKRPDPERCTGHHGIMLTGSDNLVTGFAFKQRFIHDITVQNVSCAGNVISGGSGIDLNLDHHKEGPFANVFTDLQCGAGSRVWDSSGGPLIGRHAGFKEVFWNIRADRGITAPDKDWGPEQISLVGVVTDGASTSGTGRWVETIPATRLDPPDIHVAQVRRRLDAQQR